MTDHPRSLQDLLDRARAQAGLRDHRGSFDDDYEAMDAERSPRAAWLPFIRAGGHVGRCLPWVDL